MPLSNRKATLDLRLANGKSYDVVFFAYYTENPSQTVEIHGEINPLYYDLSFADKSITVKYDNATANDEKRDCFWHAVRGMKVEGAANRTFKLTRPLAQLNLGVTETDYNTALNSEFRIANTEITVDSYTKFNIFDGTLSELKPTTITFAGAQTPLYSDEYLIIDGQSERYKYLATTYLLVNQKCTSNVSVKIWDNSGFELHTLNYSFVPFQRNYRTNILGQIISSPYDFNVEILPGFAGEENENVGPDDPTPPTPPTPPTQPRIF